MRFNRNIRLLPIPDGPGPRMGLEHVMGVYVIWKFAQNKRAARKFLVDIGTQYTGHFLISLLQLPCVSGSVKNIPARLRRNTSYPNEVPGRYPILERISKNWTTNVGHPGYSNAAIDEVFNKFIIPQMFARVARSDMTADEAMRAAHREMTPIFKKAQARGRVEEVQPVVGDTQPGVVAFPEGRTPAESRHEDRAVLLADVDGVCSDGRLDVLPVDWPAVHGEVNEDLRAHVLSDVHGRRDLTVGLTFRVFEVLRANPEDERLALEPAERGSRLKKAIVDNEPMAAEPRLEPAVVSHEIRADEVHRGRADELGDEEVHGVVVEPLRYVVLLKHAVAHHSDAFADRERLRLVMGHVDRRHGEIPLDPSDLRTHLDAKLRVEVGQRLVHEKRLRLAHDCPAHRHALALAAGQSAGALAEDILEPENLGSALHAAVDLRLVELPELQPEGHVPVRGHVRVERVVLEHHRDVSVLWREVVHNPTADPEPRPRLRARVRRPSEGRSSFRILKGRREP